MRFFSELFRAFFRHDRRRSFNPGRRCEDDQRLLAFLLEGNEITAERVLISAGGWVKDFLTEPEKAEFKVCRQVLHWIETSADDWKDYPVFMWGFGPAPEDFIYGFPSLDGKTVKMATESFKETPHPGELNREVSLEEQKQFWE